VVRRGLLSSRAGELLDSYDELSLIRDSRSASISPRTAVPPPNENKKDNRSIDFFRPHG
jgi:hypothetical protein